MAGLLELEPDFRISEWVARGGRIGGFSCLSTASAKQDFQSDAPSVSRHQRFDRVGRDRDFRYCGVTTEYRPLCRVAPLRRSGVEQPCLDQRVPDPRNFRVR